MKKIYNILLLTLVIGVSSCTGVVDDIFDKSSALKADETATLDREILMSAPNGWRLEMKADPKDEMGLGAYNLFLKFNADSTVSVSNEMAKADSVITTHFSIYQSQGINLTFDEYNPFVHYFSAPINPDGFGKAGFGLKGDIDFHILKASKDEIILEGKKSAVKMRMVPIEEGKSWIDVISNIKTIESEMCKYTTYDVTFSENEVVRISRKNHTFSYIDSEGTKYIYPFVITEKGIEFLKPAVIAGHTIYGFDYKSGTSIYETNDGKGKIAPFISAAESFKNAEWFFAKSLMSEKFATAFNDGVNSMYELLNLDVNYTSLYYDAKSNTVGMWFYVGTYNGNIFYKFSKIDDNTIKLAIDSYDGNGGYFYNNGFKAFASLLSTTFTLKPDDPEAPKTMTLTSTKDSELKLTVTLAEVLKPNEH